jgi:large subunit ribosomal protein L23
MEATQVIKRPFVTEKSNWEAEGKARYTFIVDIKAKKEDIKKAIAELYKVRVTKVRTQVRKGESYKTKFGDSKESNWKKAIVSLHPEDKIDLI